MDNKLISSLKDILHLDGSIVDLRFFKGNNSRDLIQYLKRNGISERVIAVETFDGLPVSSPEDRTKHNTLPYPNGKFKISEKECNAIIKKMDYPVILKSWQKFWETNEEYKFVVIDLRRYYQTVGTLRELWSKMVYGSTIYIKNYDKTDNSSATKAVNEFIERFDDEILVSKKMSNGLYPNDIIIKCFNKEKGDRSEMLPSMDKKVAISMVYKSGGDYTVEYVSRLARSIKRNCTLDVDVVCLTDMPVEVSKIPEIDRTVSLTTGLFGWWNKVCLFKEDTFKDYTNVFYLDLDTIICDNIDDLILLNSDFMAIRDFYHLHSMGSGLMYWKPSEETKKIYDLFMSDAKRIMGKYSTVGDQGWIRDCIKNIDYFQDESPSSVVSYKAHCINGNDNGSIPKGAKIICFHGKPRPHEIQNSIRKLW